MSLGEAVLSIADALEKECDSASDILPKSIIRSFIREMRTVVKASENNPRVPENFPGNEKMLHRQKIEEIKRKMKEENGEDSALRSVLVRGGPLDGTYLPIPGETLISSRMEILGCDYQLVSGSVLQFVREVKG